MRDPVCQKFFRLHQAGAMTIHQGCAYYFCCMAGMEREVLDRTVLEAGDMAVVSTRSRLTGGFRDRELDLFSTETLVLSQTDGGWKVRHIHWSSAPAE